MPELVITTPPRPLCWREQKLVNSVAELLAQFAGRSVRKSDKELAIKLLSAPNGPLHRQATVDPTSLIG
jgi:hypothetical protein